MEIIATLKKGKRKFYLCKWECGAYSIDRITKSFGGSVIFKDTLEEVMEYARENGYKAA